MLANILQWLKRPSLKIAARVVAIYLLVSASWIFFSDRLLELWVRDPDRLSLLQTYKGWAFVAASGALLFFLLLRELEGRRIAEEALGRSQSAFNYLFARNPHPMWVYDQDTLAFLAVNDAAVTLYGYTRAEFLGMTIKDIRPGEDVPRLLETLDAGGTFPRRVVAARHRYKDGSQHSMRITAHTIEFDGRGAVMVIAEDVSAQEEAQASLREAEQQRQELERIINRSPAVAFHWRPDEGWPVEFVSDNITRYGYQPRDFLEGGLDYDRIICPDDFPGVSREFDQFLESGRDQFVQEYRILDKNGGLHWVEERSWLRNPEQGPTGGYQGLILNIDARKAAQEALYRSEQRLHEVLDFLPDPTFAVDEQGRVVLWNHAMEAFSGISAADILGQGDQAYALPFFPQRRPLLVDLAIHPEQSDYHTYYPTLGRDGQVLTVETYLPNFHGGTYIWAKAIPLYDANGKTNGAIEVVRDVTERRLRERDLEALVKAAAALRAAQRLSQIYPLLLEQVMSSLPAEGAWIASLDPDGGTIRVELGMGSATSQTGKNVVQGEGPDGQAIASGMAVRSLQGALAGEGMDQGDGAAAYIAAPLISQGQTIGALVAVSGAALSESGVQMLVGIADIAANAIQRALLLEQTQNQLNRLLALRSIDTAITASLDVRVTLNVLLDQVMSQLSIDATDILLYDASQHRLDFTAGRGFHSGIAGKAQLRLGEGLPVKSLLQGKIIYIEDLNRDGYSYLRQNLLGGEGFISYYAVPLVAKGEFKGVLELFHRSTHRATQDWMDFLQSLAAQAAIAIDNAALFDHLQRANLELSLAYDATIEGWSRALELRDRETQGHALRVVELSMRLARRLGIPEKEMVHVRRGVLLHDIGKMGIPDSILLKPGPLNEEEWVVMRRHPEYAYNLLAPIRHLTPALDIPYCHHERWNGSGYPRGLNGVQIPLTARMFAVVDIWDALLSYRPYRDAWPREQVEAYLREEAGKTLDPEVVDVFLKMVYEEEGKLN